MEGAGYSLLLSGSSMLLSNVVWEELVTVKCCMGGAGYCQMCGRSWLLSNVVCKELVTVYC